MQQDILPKLRPITAIQATLPNGQNVIILRDPTGVARQDVIISVEVLDLLHFFDGETKISELKSGLLRMGADLDRLGVIDDLIEALDRGLIIEGNSYRIASENFRRQTWRYSVHDGTAYPENAAACDRFIRSWLHDSTMEVPDNIILPSDSVQLGAVIAPHYDLRGSGPVVATAHRAMWADFEKHGEPDTVVVIGTAHFPIPNGLAISKKTYFLPIGEVPVDGELADALADALPFDPYEHEVYFRGEFVCEFQALLLAYYRNLHPESKIRMLPVLISSLDDMDGKPEEGIKLDGRIREIVDAIRRAEAETGRKLLFLASSDLSHVGDRFEGTPTLDDAAMISVEKTDLELLELIRDNRSDEFVRRVYQDGNPTEICSATNIYLVSELVRDRFEKAEILQYTQMHEEEENSMVSYTAMALYVSEEVSSGEDRFSVISVDETHSGDGETPSDSE